MTTCEDIVRANPQLRASQAELAEAKAKVEEYARRLEGRAHWPARCGRCWTRGAGFHPARRSNDRGPRLPHPAPAKASHCLASDPAGGTLFAP
jgi:hypothetical protein